tara:strand:- start:43 stop:216 length:174 start_codon:yes stop_codon:yes gene_type:complete
MDKNEFANKVQKLMAHHTQIEKDYINKITKQQKELDFYNSLLIIKIYKFIKRIIRRF